MAVSMIGNFYLIENPNILDPSYIFPANEFIITVNGEEKQVRIGDGITSYSGLSTVALPTSVINDWITFLHSTKQSRLVTLPDLSVHYYTNMSQGSDGAVNSVNGKTGTVVLNASDVGALPSSTTIPTQLSQLTADSTHQTVTDSEKSTWNGKQDALVSGVSIKTVGGASLLGSGNIPISGGEGEQELYTVIYGVDTYENVLEEIHNGKTPICKKTGTPNVLLVYSSINTTAGTITFSATRGNLIMTATLTSEDVWSYAEVTTSGGVSSLNGQTGALTLKTVGGQSLLGSGDIPTGGGSGGEGVFIAVYGSTEFSAIKSAVDGGQIPVAIRENDNRVYMLSGQSETKYTFSCVDVDVLKVDEVSVTSVGWDNGGWYLQSKLVSSTTIKTINGNSLLSNGDISTRHAIATFSSSSVQLNNNETKYHTGTPTSLTVTFAAPSSGVDYITGVIFKAGSSFQYSHTAPSGYSIKWVNEPTWTSGKVYEIIYRCLWKDNIIAAKYAEVTV